MTDRTRPQKQKFPVIALCLILGIALFMRINALWLPHWRGDQAQYVILAMKLKHFGMDGYNLRRVDMGVLNVSPSENLRIEYSAVKPRADDTIGAYLEMMKSIGQSYYDEPLHVRAPLFPAALALSHTLFVRSDQPFMVLSYGFRQPAEALRSWNIWRGQLWAAAIPLFFNLATIALTAYLAWILFASTAVTLAAAVLLASNPISIWLAHKLLTEDMTTFFVTLSVTAMAVLWQRNRVFAGAAAGVLAGAAVLVNQRSGLIMPAELVFAWMVLRQDAAEGQPGLNTAWDNIRGLAHNIMRTAHQPFFWIYGVAFAGVTGPWFWKVTSFYGNPLNQPSQKTTEAISGDLTGWFAAVASRPHPTFIYSFGVVILYPLFVFALTTWKRSWGGWTGRAKDLTTRGLSLLWIWTAVFFIYMANLTNIFSSGNKEHRYFYPVYPALAVLAAFGLNDLRSKLEKKYPGYVRHIRGIVLILMIMNAVWGCLQAYPKIFADELLF